jgi:hypothetical protein
MEARFFLHREYERLDTPHATAHGDPWDSDKAFPGIFRWRYMVRKFLGFLPIPGLGSYYPHLFLALAAEYFFRSWLIVTLGIFAWTILVELPVFLALQYTSLLPSDRSLWDTIPIYYKENPSGEEITEAFSYKKYYDKPKSGVYYAIIGLRRKRIRSTFRNPMLYKDSEKRNQDSPFKEIHGFAYKKKDISSYILYAILVDVLVGIGAALIAYYIHRSFDLNALRDSADGILVLEYLGLFFLVSHLISYWGWLFSIVAFGYIFILAAANMHQDVFSWTPYLVLFGLTVYYWIVFFRNPFRWLYFFSHPQSDMGEENRVGEGEVGVFSGSVHGKNLEVLAEENTSSAHTSMRTGKYSDQYDIPVHVDVDGDGVVDVTLPPTQVIEDAGLVFSDHSSWWLFAATNYDSFGYNGWFGSMILLIIVAIVAIVV